MTDTPDPRPRKGLLKRTIPEARALIEKEFDAGNCDCRSCGWNALPYEHQISDEDIYDAIEGDGILELECQSQNDLEGRHEHRGTSIDLHAP